MTDKLKGFWKDGKDKKPYVKPSKLKVRRRKRKNEVKYDAPKDLFYSSKEWRQLRYMVLKHYGGACMLCGRTSRHHGVVIHVDHIKPRARCPDLSLRFDNLQVLCEDCNLGKMTQFDDWRPPSQEEVEKLLDRQLLSTSPL